MSTSLLHLDIGIPSIHLEGCGISWYGLQELAKLKQLEQLRLGT